MAVDPHIMLAVGHILIIAPFLLYVGIQRAAIPGWIYTLLLVLGGVLFLYHGYRAYIRIIKASPYAWVNLIHAIIVAPLLLYIGFKGRESPRYAYELLLMVGFAALGYHLYSLIVSMQVHNNQNIIVKKD